MPARGGTCWRSFARTSLLRGLAASYNAHAEQTGRCEWSHNARVVRAFLVLPLSSSPLSRRHPTAPRSRARLTKNGPVIALVAGGIRTPRLISPPFELRHRFAADSNYRRRFSEFTGVTELLKGKFVPLRFLHGRFTPVYNPPFISRRVLPSAYLCSLLNK